MSAAWYDDRRNLAAVTRRMGEQGDSAEDIAYMLEKPWKFEDEWRLSKPEGVGTGAGEGAPMSELIHKATDRVRRFLDARDGYFPIDVLAVHTRTGDRLLASDLRTLLAEVDEAWADGYNHAKVEMLSASIGDRAECATCSGRGVWMDEPCSDCAGVASDD